MQIKFCLLSDFAKFPEYAHPGDAGADVFAGENVLIEPGQWLAVKTDLAAEIPVGFEIQIRPKSGIAFNHGVTVLNSPGTIDAGYRGNIKVILINHGTKPFHISVGQKIAQFVICPVIQSSFSASFALSESERDIGGFGSTGV